MRFAVDVRRLPWMRRLAVDYAFDFARLDRRSSAATRPTPRRGTTAIAAAQGHAPPRREIAEIVVAQQQRRGAPARSHRGRAAAGRTGRRSRSSPASRPGLFGGPVFTLLKAATAIRLARARRARAPRRGRPGVLDRRGGPRLGGSARGALCSTRELNVASIEAATPEGAGERTIGSLAWPDGIVDATDALFQALPATEFTPWLGRSPCGLRAGTRRRRVVRPHARRGARAPRPGRVRLVGPGGQAAGRGPLRARARTPRAHGAARRPRRCRPGVTRLSHAGHAARGQRRALRAGRRPCADQARRTATSSSATAAGAGCRDGRTGAHASGGVQPERAAAPARAGRAVSDGLLRGRPERARLPWRSCAASTQRSACRCR